MLKLVRPYMEPLLLLEVVSLLLTFASRKRTNARATAAGTLHSQGPLHTGAQDMAPVCGTWLPCFRSKGGAAYHLESLSAAQRWASQGSCSNTDSLPGRIEWPVSVAEVCACPSQERKARAS